MTENLKTQIETLCKALFEKKAADILALYVGDKTIIADYFVVVSGRSVPQVQTLADTVSAKAAELGMKLLRTEGYAEGRWIVLDFSYVLFHIFHPEERTYYNIERLWQDDSNAVDYNALFSAELEQT